MCLLNFNNAHYLKIYSVSMCRVKSLMFNKTNKIWYVGNYRRFTKYVVLQLKIKPPLYIQRGLI